MPPGTGAFYLYAEPNTLSTMSITATASDVRGGSGTFVGISVLQRATRLPGWTVPQSQLLLRPGLLTVQAERRVVDCQIELFDAPTATAPAKADLGH